MDVAAPQIDSVRQDGIDVPIGGVVSQKVIYILFQEVNKVCV